MPSVEQLAARLAALEYKLMTGGWCSPMYGFPSVALRDRFPVRLTSTYSASEGYSWERLVLDRSTDPDVPTVAEVSSPQADSYAFTPDNNEDLAVGQRGWLEADPTAGGWLFLPMAAAGVPGSLQVEDTDESPSVSSVTQLRLDSADGFVVSTPGGGIARVDMLAATTTQAGIVSTAAQTWAGDKGLLNSYWLVTDGTSMLMSMGFFIIGSDEMPAIDSVVGSDTITLYLDAANYRIVANSTSLISGNTKYAVQSSSAGVLDGVTGSFTTADGKTVAVTGGIITSIV